MPPRRQQDISGSCRALRCEFGCAHQHQPEDFVATLKLLEAKVEDAYEIVDPDLRAFESERRERWRDRAKARIEQFQAVDRLTAQSCRDEE